MEGEAVATGVELTPLSGVAVGVAEIAVAVGSSTPDESSEELQATASNDNSSTAINADAPNTCHFGPVRKSVVDGKLLC
jgi:hypothetical protein